MEKAGCWRTVWRKVAASESDIRLLVRNFLAFVSAEHNVLEVSGEQRNELIFHRRQSPQVFSSFEAICLGSPSFPNMLVSIYYATEAQFIQR